MRPKKGFFCFFLVFLVSHLEAASERYDIMVYGATAGGSLAAVAAALEVSRVALLEPGSHLGGMLTGGLGRTDMDRQQHVIGGLPFQFFREAGRHYGQDLTWTFEPKVAEAILNRWIQEAGLEVLHAHQTETVLHALTMYTKNYTWNRNRRIFLNFHMESVNLEMISSYWLWRVGPCRQ